MIVIENLDLKKMKEKKNLAKDISYLAFYQFRSFLKYKCEWYGKELLIANRYFPSTKICSSCGSKNNVKLLRSYICPKCKTLHNRDINAATNLYNIGLYKFKTGKVITSGHYSDLLSQSTVILTESDVCGDSH